MTSNPWPEQCNGMAMAAWASDVRVCRILHQIVTTSETSPAGFPIHMYIYNGNTPHETHLASPLRDASHPPQHRRLRTVMEQLLVSVAWSSSMTTSLTSTLTSLLMWRDDQAIEWGPFQGGIHVTLVAMETQRTELHFRHHRGV